MVLTIVLLKLGYWISLALALVFAYLSGWIWWLSFVSSFILFFSLYLSILRIPASLSWSRNLYSDVFIGIIAFQILAIMTYAIICFRSQNFSEITNFLDALYFSLTTWTTLSFGDIAPPSRLRLITSLESFTGLSTIPVIAAMIWKYCEDRFRGRAADEDTMEGLVVQLDNTTGAFIDPPNEKAKFEADISKRLKLKPCRRCQSKDVVIERIYDVIGRMVPMVKFIIRCKKCKNFTKPRPIVYFAAWEWNRGKRH